MAYTPPQLLDGAGDPIYLYTGASMNPTIEFQHTDGDGVPIDISGWTIEVDGREYNTSSTAGTSVFSALTATVSDGPAGKFTVPFDSLTLTTATKNVVLWFRQSGAAVFARYQTDVILR